MSSAAPDHIRRHRWLSQLWEWSHNNGLTLLCIAFFNTLGTIITVITCH